MCMNPFLHGLMTLERVPHSCPDLGVAKFAMRIVSQIDIPQLPPTRHAGAHSFFAP